MTRDTPDISPADEQIEIVSGRGELPWTQVHDWIALSGIGPASIGAYVALKMHLNRQTGQLNPGTVRLAKLLQLSRADKVAALVRPLVEIGAVEVVAYGMPRRNRYVVHSLPPEGYEGPLTLAQWAKRHEPEITRERARQAKKAERARNRRSTPVTPESGLLDDSPPVTPESGLQVPPESGLHVPPKSGVEPDVGEPDVVEPDEAPPPPSPRAADRRVVDTREEEDKETNDRMVETARTVLHTAMRGLSPMRCPDRGQSDRLVELVVGALSSGWSSRDLAQRIGAGDLSHVESVYAVLRYRLERLGQPPTTVSGDPHTMSPDRSWRDHRPPATDASAKAREFARMLAKRPVRTRA